MVSVAVTTPVVFAATAFTSATEMVSVIVTLALPACTKVSAVTSAAVTSAAVPVITTALLTVTTPVVFAPSALSALGPSVTPAASLTVIV